MLTLFNENVVKWFLYCGFYIAHIHCVYSLSALPLCLTNNGFDIYYKLPKYVTFY